MAQKMSFHQSLRILAFCTAATGCFLSSVTLAQTAAQPPLMPPEVKLLDENGVNLMSGQVSFQFPSVAIGSGVFRIERAVQYNSVSQSEFSDSMTAGLEHSGAKLGLGIESLQGVAVNGGQFVYNNNGTALYELRDGTRVEIALEPGSTIGSATKVTFPNGKVWRYAYDVITTATGSYKQLRSVAQSNGLVIRYDYAGATTQVTAYNLASDFCAVTAASCQFAQIWPRGQDTVGSSPTSLATGWQNSYQNAAGEVMILNFNRDSQIQSAMLPASNGQVSVVYDRCNRLNPPAYKCFWGKATTPGVGPTIYPLYDRVISATRGNAAWNFDYTWSIGCCYAKYRRTDPYGEVKKVFFYSYANDSWPVYVQDSKAKYTYSNNIASRITEALYVEGNKKLFTYDPRGNLTEIAHHPKPGSAETVLYERAGFAATCTSRLVCNQPTWTEDKQGNRTDFEYDPVHGQVTRVSLPAVNEIRPVERYYYTRLFARYYGPGGAIVQDPDGVWLLTAKKTCSSSATVGDGCAVAGDEVTLTYDYGPATGLNNLWLRGEAVESQGTILRTCYGYDRFGNRISTTEPRSGLASCN